MIVKKSAWFQYPELNQRDFETNEDLRPFDFFQNSLLTFELSKNWKYGFVWNVGKSYKNVFTFLLLLWNFYIPHSRWCGVHILNDCFLPCYTKEIKSDFRIFVERYFHLFSALKRKLGQSGGVCVINIDRAFVTFCILKCLILFSHYLLISLFDIIVN